MTRFLLHLLSNSWGTLRILHSGTLVKVVFGVTKTVFVIIYMTRVLLHSSNKWQPRGYSSLVLVGMCHTEFESRPIQIPIFQEKVTHSYTNRINFVPNIEQNHRFFINFIKFEPILAQTWENFEKSTHSYTEFCILKGSIHTWRGWFCSPCWRHIPVRSFVLSTPPWQPLFCGLPGLKIWWES